MTRRTLPGVQWAYGTSTAQPSEDNPAAMLSGSNVVKMVAASVPSDSTGMTL